MPEYLAPGVYIEETSFRSKSIEGVSTSTAGFVGPARYGPTAGMPELCTSLAEYERVFGGLDQLSYEQETDPSHNYLAHGIRSFFENGGRRVYVTRVYEPGAAPTSGPAVTAPWGHLGSPARGLVGRAWVAVAGVGNESLTMVARYPGRAGNMRVAFTFRVSENVLSSEPDALDPTTRNPVLKGVTSNEVVWLQDAGSPPDAADPTSASGTLYRAWRYFDDSLNRWNWQLLPESASETPLDLDTEVFTGLQTIRRVSATVEVTFLDAEGQATRRETWEDLTFDPHHRNSIASVFADDLPNRTQQLTVPFVFYAHHGTATMNGPAIARVLLESLGTAYSGTVRRADQQTTLFTLQHGSDGLRPKPETYEGQEIDPKMKSGLKALADIPDVSILAAPGHTVASPNAARADAMTRALATMGLMLAHCERVKYTIAVLDSIEGQAIPDIRALRAQVDSTRGALYYPFVRVLDPVTDREINLPPSGFVAGIYARNDVEHGVHKAPANEVVSGAIKFEVMINKAQQDVLNPENINVLRFFEGRGYRVWGARTISSDPEWKYVNVRRYFLYLERSIERGTQWAVFENNGDALWANVRDTIEDFLYNEWNSGHLLGLKPEDAYFVRCDRTTMTQNDLDNGRLVCLIGVAPLRPAEFVIFRIGQWTASRPT